MALASGKLVESDLAVQIPTFKNLEAALLFDFIKQMKDIDDSFKTKPAENWSSFWVDEKTTKNFFCAFFSFNIRNRMSIMMIYISILFLLLHYIQILIHQLEHLSHAIHTNIIFIKCDNTKKEKKGISYQHKIRYRKWKKLTLFWTSCFDYMLFYCYTFRQVA